MNHKTEVSFNKVIFTKRKADCPDSMFYISIKIQLYEEAKREKKNESFPYLFCAQYILFIFEKLVMFYMLQFQHHNDLDPGQMINDYRKCQQSIDY